MRVKTVVLDDDPTGSQCVQDVTVALEHDPALFARLLASEDPGFFVVTNIRALPSADAVAVLARVRAQLADAAAAVGCGLRLVLRGDSTLRGHLAAELEMFSGPRTVILLVPAFPAGERITRNDRHLVRIDGEWLDAADTEFARDTTFGYTERALTDFVRVHAGGRIAVPVATASVAEALQQAAPGSVVVPDATSDDDIALIAEQYSAAVEAGVDVLVRCASPLAAALLGRWQRQLLPPLAAARRTLVVCGSHTAAATRQLAELAYVAGDPILVDTDAALADPARAAAQAALLVRARLGQAPLAVLATERARRADHGALDAGARVMSALCVAVQSVRTEVDLVVAKGGITSAEVARLGLGAASARVLGQLQVGISHWRLADYDNGANDYVVVPGNVGGPSTLRTLIDGTLSDVRG